MDEIQKPGESNEVEGFPQSYAVGEATAKDEMPNYGQNNQRIPEHYQNIFRGLCKKVAQRDMFARISEVRKAGELRFAWRNMLDVIYDEGQNSWAMVGGVNGVGVGPRETNENGDTDLHYDLNLIQAFGRGFISIVSQVPNVRMEATKVDAPDALRIAGSADALRKHIEAQNEMDDVIEDACRLAWTDGRVSFYQRWVTDGARFGYEDQTHANESQEGIGKGGNPPQKRPRQPKGGEVTTAYGVLECKVPINMRRQSDFPFRQLSYEIDLTSAKSMYPWIGEKFTGGQPGPGEYNFDRSTRIATTQGVRLLAESGDTVQQLPTYQRTWFRPSFFVEVGEEDRQWFIDNYPDGAMVAFVGETYAESRNESMDDHWVDWHPLPGDGQSTPSCAEIIMPVQMEVCDLNDLFMEAAMKGIPAVYCDKDVVDLQAISKQKAGPGAHYPATKPEGGKLADGFFVETAPEIPAQLETLFAKCFSDIPQFLTGLFPAALGGSDPDNQTKGGLELLAGQSKGQAGVAWRSLRKAYAKLLTQLVRIGAYFRESEAKNGVLKLDQVEIDLEDLRDGNWACKPDGDESYPTTHSERKEAWMAVIGIASKNPAAAAILADPENLVQIKDAIGLEGMVIPGADAAEKQMGEIKRMLADGPVPNIQAVQAYMQQAQLAAAQGLPVPPPPPKEQMYQTSLPLQKYDDDANEFKAGVDWLKSGEGQQTREQNPDGVLNVELHLGLHQARMQQAQKDQMAQQIQAMGAAEQAKAAAKPAKTPAESINFKDLGPAGQLQVGRQAGLDLHADVAAQLAEEAMGGGQQNPQQPEKPVQ